MEAGIVVELGVESGGELVALTGGNDVLIYSGDGLTVVGGNRLDVGRTDEGHARMKVMGTSEPMSVTEPTVWKLPN